MPRFDRQPATNLLATFLLAIAILSSSISCSGNRGERTVTVPTRPSAANGTAVRLLDLDGKPFDLRQASHGRVHVVIFIRSDCPISNRMAPEVRELCTSFQPQRVDFYLIYVDPREQPEAIRAHLREYGFSCPALRDPDHTLVADTKATVTPEAFVFDRNWTTTYRGRINDQFEDFGKSREVPTKHDLRNAIDATLGGRPVADPVTEAIGCYIKDLK